ncbi:protein javelin, partial [Coccinella septempunctata]|uniref:protein javelin n=1 Tax=Coccinella septempunctata TaxID=41139 RepID=UPI001D088DFC
NSVFSCFQKLERLSSSERNLNIHIFFYIRVSRLALIYIYKFESSSSAGEDYLFKCDQFSRTRSSVVILWLSDFFFKCSKIGTGHSSNNGQGVVHEGQAQLWLSEDNVYKRQGQRERRVDVESCINNLRIANQPKERRQSRRTSNTNLDHATYTKPTREKLKYEKRSLENVSNIRIESTNAEYPPSLRRCRSLALTKEDVFNSLEISNDGRPSRRAQLIPRVKLQSKTVREQSSRYGSYRASNEELYTRPNRPKHNPEPHQHNPGKPSRQISVPPDKRNRIDENEYDSLEYRPPTNRQNEEPPSLKLPNYYPDSIYESDNTEYTSTAENLSVRGKKYLSCDNISGQNFQQEPESISYDENIVLSKNRPLYSSLQDAAVYEKPKTIRSPSVLRSAEEYFSARPDKTELIEEDKVEKEERNSTKSDDRNASEVYASVEINPLYEQTNVSEEKTEKSIENRAQEHTTTLQIHFSDNDHPIPEDTKTVIKVEPNLTSNSTDDETKEVDQPKKEQKHSHKYLREFLESQKGSKKPLQNFLSKKFPNLSRRNSKEIQTNLIDNNFYSLPDIAACKNLRKCDKIDRKLRKCDKTAKSGESDDRFIVNIGRHFDLTNNNVPVDFELKIAKIPKKNKPRGKDKPEAFIQAVRDLKRTLGENQEKSDTKPEIIAVQRKSSADSVIEEKEKMDNNQSGLEYQDKLDNMRNYWKKLVGYEEKNQEDETKSEKEVKTKVEEVKKKFEPTPEPAEQTNKVKKTKEIFESKNKTSVKSSKGIFENPTFERDNPFESLNPNIVEVIENKTENGEHKGKPDLEKVSAPDRKCSPVTKSLSITYPEFDHVRYRVVKSNLFQKKIFANYEKESQFDGLMQYLQDYSFQELLMDNNIVIIEPIRTTLIRENNNKYKGPSKNITPLLHTNIEQKNDKNTLRKHFFFHPIRVNKEVNDDELPNPDTVKQVRQMFEKNEDQIVNPMKKISENNGNKYNTDKVNTNDQNMPEMYNDEQWDSFDEEACCEQQYITEDMMEKIRRYGTTITYYGGRIVRKQSSQESLTNVILEEIKNNEINTKNDASKNEDSHNSRLRFKLVKSNSCSSRMELVGTKNLASSKQNYRNKHEAIKKQLEEKRQDNSNNNNNDEKTLNKNEINECIRKQNIQKQEVENKIYTKWGETNGDQTFYGIKLNDKLNDARVIHDYHTNFEKNKNKSKIIEEMDFEPFEIA